MYLIRGRLNRVLLSGQILGQKGFSDWWQMAVLSLESSRGATLLVGIKGFSGGERCDVRPEASCVVFKINTVMLLPCRSEPSWAEPSPGPDRDSFEACVRRSGCVQPCCHVGSLFTCCRDIREGVCVRACVRRVCVCVCVDGNSRSFHLHALLLKWCLFSTHRGKIAAVIMCHEFRVDPFQHRGQLHGENKRRICIAWCQGLSAFYRPREKTKNNYKKPLLPSLHPCLVFCLRARMEVSVTSSLLTHTRFKMTDFTMSFREVFFLFIFLWRLHFTSFSKSYREEFNPRASTSVSYMRRALYPKSYLSAVIQTMFFWSFDCHQVG